MVVAVVVALVVVVVVEGKQYKYKTELNAWLALRQRADLL